METRRIDPPKPQEGGESMEQILSSIRKIMSSELEDIQPRKTKKRNEDVLDLTKRVDAKVEHQAKPSSTSQATIAPSFKTAEPASFSDHLISSETLSASVNALSQLNRAVHGQADSSPLSHHKGENSPTLDSFMAELLRPLLKEWLDKNLPRIVESIVQKEIQSLKQRM